MAENKKSFVLYADYLDTFEMLSDEEAGQLIKHLFRYVNDEEPELQNKLLGIAFNPIKSQLKRDLMKWSDTKGKRSEAGKASAEARRLKKQQTSTNPTSVESVQQTSTNPTVNVNDTVTVNVTDTVTDTVSVILKRDSTKISIIKNLRNFGFEIPDYDSAVEMFNDKLIAEDDTHKTQSEIRKHFSNWLKIELKNIKKEKNYGSTSDTRTTEERVADIMRLRNSQKSQTE